MLTWGGHSNTAQRGPEWGMGEARWGDWGWGTQNIERRGRCPQAGRNRGPSELDYGGAPWTPAKSPHLLPTQNTLQGELYYANLELQTRTLQGEPMQPRQEEVEYSTVVSVRAWRLAGGGGGEGLGSVRGTALGGGSRQRGKGGAGLVTLCPTNTGPHRT